MLSSAGMATVVFAIIQAPDWAWASGPRLVTVAAGLAVLALFVNVESRMERPMLDVRLFRNPRFTAASGSITIGFFTLAGFSFLITQYRPRRVVPFASYDRRVSPPAAANTGPKDERQAFDLNIEKVLEHWPVAYAVREVIANALDEQVITGTAAPCITRVGEGDWLVRDFGRGLRYEHLTQKENAEKLKHPAVIGQFGIGLKDALAVCDRRNVRVSVRSRHGDISTAQLPKAGFPDVVTLHALVSAPSDPEMVGTEVRFVGVTDADIEAAKGFFLHYSGISPLETTRYGEVLARPAAGSPARIYVKGLLVAEEPNFLFSYNITAINAALRKALNRERSNVGRTAYSDRVKEVLKECTTPGVAAPLTADLGRFTAGRMHDELGWKDVAVHACRVLQTAEKVLFVTVLQSGLPSVHHARDDGYRMVIVPDDIARALGPLRDLLGNPMFDLSRFHEEWNESFTYSFVSGEQLTPAERAVYDLTRPAAALAGVDLDGEEITVEISETTRLSERGAEVLGVWEPEERRIVVRRDQLGNAAGYFGTLLHELTHAVSGFGDLTFEFEEALSAQMGAVAHSGLERSPGPLAWSSDPADSR